MYDPPAYLWAITIAGPIAVAALTCIVLYGGAQRSGLGRKRSALLAGAAAVLLARCCSVHRLDEACPVPSGGPGWRASWRRPQTCR